MRTAVFQTHVQNRSFPDCATQYVGVSLRPYLCDGRCDQLQFCNADTWDTEDSESDFHSTCFPQFMLGYHVDCHICVFILTSGPAPQVASVM